MRATVRSQQGSAVLLAVMAMLVMGVLSVSFWLLADVESRAGVSHEQLAQAEAAADAGLEHGGDLVRAAATASGGFTDWLNGVRATHMLIAGGTLNGATYWARIDNDCPPAVPSAIREGADRSPAPVCNRETDANGVAVITAWAVAGAGRSRARVIVTVDSPWQHVCARARPDDGPHCNEPGDGNGTPAVSPSDPNDPNGPQGYADLPRPYLGCSRVAAGLHKAAGVTDAEQHARCYPPLGAWQGVYAYPYPTGPGPRMVMMGGLPGPAGGFPRSCHDEPAGGNGNRYFGHFDCAVTTYCRPAEGDVCPAGATRVGCLRGPLFAARFGGLPDTRVVPGHPNQVASNNPIGTRWVEYDPAAGTCSGGHTGMVWTGPATFNTDVGSPTKQLDVYVMGHWGQGSNLKFYGTLAVEGTTAGGPVFSVGNGATAELWSGPSTAAAAGWGFSRTYGYPLVAVVYNPALPPPTIQPTYGPQPLTADFGTGTPRIHGIIYSGGRVQFGPLTLDGSVVAFEIQTRGGASYTYNATYGDDTPPSGFPPGAGNRVSVIRKSFVACSGYNDDSGGPTPCN